MADTRAAMPLQSLGDNGNSLEPLVLSCKKLGLPEPRARSEQRSWRAAAPTAPAPAAARGKLQPTPQHHTQQQQQQQQSEISRAVSSGSYAHSNSPGRPHSPAALEQLTVGCVSPGQPRAPSPKGRGKLHRGGTPTLRGDDATADQQKKLHLPAGASPELQQLPAAMTGWQLQLPLVTPGQNVADGATTAAAAATAATAAAVDVSNITSTVNSGRLRSGQRLGSQQQQHQQRERALTAAQAAFKASLDTLSTLGQEGAARGRRGAIVRRLRAAHIHTFGTPTFQRTLQNRAPSPPPSKLDGFMLVESCDEDLPEEVESAQLSSSGIQDVEAADLPFFTRLKQLLLNDNRLPSLSCLAGLPAIVRLQLSANHLAALGPLQPSELQGDAFGSLVALDLSYNRLQGDVMGAESWLGQLPSLRELNLSGNSIKQLPPWLAAFPALQTLQLSHNKLGGGALLPLRQLSALTALDLSHNHITTIPDLDGSQSGSYSWLRLLDLSHNRLDILICTLQLRELPTLQAVLLVGNPGVRRLQSKPSPLVDGAPTKASLAATTAAAVANLELLLPPFVLHEAPADSSKPTVARTLLRHNGGNAVEEAWHSQVAVAVAAQLPIGNVDEGELTEVFDRLHAGMDAWHLNSVQEEGGDDEAALEDNTFMTGIGLMERPGSAGTSDDEDACATADDGATAWQCPTERLAIALGLDIARLASHTGAVAHDTHSATADLRFALAHPIVEIDAGLQAPKQYLRMTTSTRAKRQERRLLPLQPALVLPPSTIKMQKIETLEGVLANMKNRLQALEANLGQQLAVAQQAAASNSQAARSTAVVVPSVGAGRVVASMDSTHSVASSEPDEGQLEQ